MIKNIFYKTLGILCIGLAYIGFVVPGIPFSIFLVIAAWAFAKSSPRMHAWLYNHPLFGNFLTNWTEKRVFPKKAKYLMIITMSVTLVVTYIFTENMKAILWSGGFMALVAVWAWRYPHSIEEHQRRIDAGEKIAWLR